MSNVNSTSSNGWSKVCSDLARFCSLNVHRVVFEEQQHHWSLLRAVLLSSLNVFLAPSVAHAHHHRLLVARREEIFHSVCLFVCVLFSSLRV